MTIQSASGQIDLVTHGGDTTSVAALPQNQYVDINSATPTSNVLITGSQTLTGTASGVTSANAVLIRSATNVTLSPAANTTQSLAIPGTGMLVVTGGTTGHTISANVDFGTSEANVAALNNVLEISGIVSGTGAVNKSGAGELKLSGANTRNKDLFVLITSNC